MALPAGVTTADVTVGAPVTFAGMPIRSNVTIEPSVFLVHTATGTPLVNLIESTDTLESLVGQFTLPHTDQDGFQDENGNPYKNWYYTATITYSSYSGSRPPLKKTFQLATGQSVVDLDLIPSGVPALPFSAPIVPVTSVAGQTGAVSALSIIEDPDVQGELSATYATLDPNGKQPVRKGELFLNVKDFGAAGDGATDDTAAVQAWMDAGGAYLRDVTLRITAGLTLSGNNRSLFMDNAKIIADGTNITALTVTGNNCRVRATIDGNNKANYGIKASGAAFLAEDCVIENLYSATLTTRGIEVTTNDGCTIRNNIIRNIVSAGDTTLGNNNGSARAIVLVGSADATAPSVIQANVIRNINGEEGDGIQVLFVSAATSYPTANATIADNDIANVSRRFIKIQASGCNVLSNTLRHDGTVPSYPANAIDVIQADNVRVEDNRIGPNPLTLQISVVGTSTDLTANAIIRNNTIRQDDAKNALSIYCNYITESALQDNTIHGGAGGISLGNSSNVLVANNTQFGGLTTSTSFSANSTNTGVVMRNNVNMASGRAATYSNSGTGALSEYNAKRP